MGIFKLLKKPNLLYKHCTFIFSPGKTIDCHLTCSRDFFSFFFYCDNKSMHESTLYTIVFSRNESNACYQLRSIVPYYWVVEILRMNNSIPFSFASIWLYTTCFYFYLPPNHQPCVWPVQCMFLFTYPGVSLSGHTILVTYDSRATKWIYSRYILNN